jgi:hypothetical protein
MLLASNKQHKEITKTERQQEIQHRKGQQGRTKTNFWKGLVHTFNRLNYWQAL